MQVDLYNGCKTVVVVVVVVMCLYTVCCYMVPLTHTRLTALFPGLPR